MDEGDRKIILARAHASFMLTEVVKGFPLTDNVLLRRFQEGCLERRISWEECRQLEQILDPNKKLRMDKKMVDELLFEPMGVRGGAAQKREIIKGQYFEPGLEGELISIYEPNLLKKLVRSVINR